MSYSLWGQKAKDLNDPVNHDGMITLVCRTMILHAMQCGQE